jgi:hypothetical protein
VRLDIKRARQIQWTKLEPEQRETLKGFEKDQAQLEKHRETARQTLDTFDFVESTEESFNLLAEQIAMMLDELRHIKTDLQQFLKPIPPKTESEQAVMDMLRGQREMDLTDLVLKTEQDATQVMDGLIIISGNQVIIKVSRRGWRMILPN